MKTKKNIKNIKNKKNKNGGSNTNSNNNNSKLLKFMKNEWQEKMSELLDDFDKNSEIKLEEIIIFFKFRLEIDKENMYQIIDKLPEINSNPEQSLIRKNIFKQEFEKVIGNKIILN